jgi:hypothetical protein
MKKIVFALALTLAFAIPASAGAIVIFTACDGTAAACSSDGAPWFQVNLDARHDGTNMPGGDARIDFINNIIYGDNAFGFNIAGSHDGLRLFDFSPGYSVGGTDESIGPWGTFQYLIDGPPPRSSSLSFWIGRDEGFMDPMQVLALNDAGFLAGANAYDFFDPSQTATWGANQYLNNAPVPEPGTMLLLATGLAAAWRGRRAAAGS